VLETLAAELRRRAPASARLQWIRASVGQMIKLIPVDEVLYFQSDSKYTRVATREGEALPPFEAPIAWPSIGLRYSTDDLLRFAAWQLVERDASVKVAHQPTWFTPDRSESIALQWLVSDTSRGRRLSASGGTYGFASVIELYPDAKLALVLLANKAAAGAQDSLRALAAKMVEELRSESISRPSPAGVPPAAR